MDNLPHNYDAWRLDNGESNSCHCEKCEEKVKSDSELYEMTNDEYYCPRCAEDYQVCARCSRGIIDSDYSHDELCDSCCDIQADKYEGGSER